MPVPRNQAAMTTLGTLLTEGHHDDPGDVVEYPDATIEQPDGWLWHTGAPQPGLQHPDAYTLADSSASPGQLHASPAEALAGSGTAPFTDNQNEYCRRSLDVTMKGGTTSAVIYPLALCELARHFRFRNLGGASGWSRWVAQAITSASPGKPCRSRPWATCSSPRVSVRRWPDAARVRPSSAAAPRAAAIAPADAPPRLRNRKCRASSHSAKG